MEVGARRAGSKPGKRSRREVTAERRQKESEAFHEIFEVLPISKSQLDKTNQNSLLALTTNYMRVRELAKQMGKTIVDMKNVSMEEQLMFRGFVLVVDTSRVILYASENITEQLGPCLADVIGQTFCDLIHPSDRRDLVNSCQQECCPEDRKGMFVIRLRTSMAPALRSEARMEYKNVFVTSFVKSFGKKCDPDSNVAVFLCRTEDLVGFPEIIMGSYMDFRIKFPKCTFTSVDPKTPWLLGYKVEDIIGQHPGIFKHPSDIEQNCQGEEEKPSQLIANLVQSGSVEFPKYRVMAAWGEWLWVSTVVSLRKDNKGQSEPSSANVRMSILGPATNGSITHIDTSMRSINDVLMANGTITNGMMANGAMTDAMLAVGAGDPNMTELMQQSRMVSGDRVSVDTTQLTSNGVDTLLDWEDLIMTTGKGTPFSDGLLDAERSSTNGSSSGYTSDPASPPWPLSTTASSSTSNLWSASSSCSPHQWPLSPKEEGQGACGGYGSPQSAHTEPSEELYTHSMSVLDIQDPFPQVDRSIDDILFSVLNAPS